MQAHTHTVAQLHRSEYCYFNNTTQSQRGNGGDVLLGEYDKQRQEMRKGEEVDVQMCPRDVHANIKPLVAQTEDTVDTNLIYSVLTFCLCLPLLSQHVSFWFLLLVPLFSYSMCTLSPPRLSTFLSLFLSPHTPQGFLLLTSRQNDI